MAIIQTPSLSENIFIIISEPDLSVEFEVLIINRWSSRFNKSGWQAA